MRNDIMKFIEKRWNRMKAIIATEQIFSPLSHGKPIAIKFYYEDGTTREKKLFKGDSKKASSHFKKLIEDHKSNNKGGK